jgi:hypothetical protein
MIVGNVVFATSAFVSCRRNNFPDDNFSIGFGLCLLAGCLCIVAANSFLSTPVRKGYEPV